MKRYISNAALWAGCLGSAGCTSSSEDAAQADATTTQVGAHSDAGTEVDAALGAGSSNQDASGRPARPDAASAGSSHDAGASSVDASLPDASSCEGSCEVDTQRCVANQLELCSVDDTDNCPSWTLSQTCELGCDGDRCATCRDSCANGETQCSADGLSVATCQPTEPDGCLEFSSESPCEFGCLAGACLDECLPNDSVCNVGKSCCSSKSGGTCTNYDTDSREPICAQACTTGRSCESGCCVPLSDGRRVCGAKEVCAARQGGIGDACAGEEQCSGELFCGNVWCAANCTLSDEECAGSGPEGVNRYGVVNRCVVDQGIGFCAPECTTDDDCKQYRNTFCGMIEGVLQGTMRSVCLLK